MLSRRDRPFPMQFGRFTTRTRSRRGAAAVEFALLLPLLLLIVLGTVDFGRFAHAYIAVTNASRAGAGFAAMNPFTNASKPSWDAKLRAVVLAELRQVIDVDPAVDDADVQVTALRTFESGQSASLWYVDVTVVMPYETLIAWPGIPSNVDLTRRVRFRGIR